MLILLALSIMAIYIFGSRWWAIRNASKIDPHFMNNIHNLIHEGKISAALNICKADNSPIARLIEKGIERIGRPLSDIQTAVENTGNVEIARLEKGLPMLATIAGGAPMIGFLGTVIGMIQAFDQIQAAGEVSATLVAGGIKVALLTTLAGLIAAVVLQLFYNYILNKIDSAVVELEDSSITLVDILTDYSKK